MINLPSVTLPSLPDAVSSWTMAVAAVTQAKTALDTANANVVSANQTAKAALVQVLSGTTVDILAIATTYKAANDDFASKTAAYHATLDTKNTALQVLAQVIAQGLGISIDAVVSILQDIVGGV